MARTMPNPGAPADGTSSESTVFPRTDTGFGPGYTVDGTKAVQSGPRDATSFPKSPADRRGRRQATITADRTGARTDATE